MRSKTFVFFVVVFILCLAIVGWYLMDGYASKAPVAMAKGAESFVEADVNTTQKYQDFFSWAQTKALIISNYVLKESKVLIK